MIFRHLLNMRSHPTWVRGLKQISDDEKKVLLVAPYVGAWIETQTQTSPEQHNQSRTLRGCVD